MKKSNDEIQRDMSRIKSKDTENELILRKALYHRGYRYYKNCKRVIGSPDIVLRGYKVVIFCDGDFWHGYDLRKIENSLENAENRDYWIKKIKKNMDRDRYVNEELGRLGYYVLRFREKDIKRNLENVIDIIDAVTGKE